MPKPNLDKERDTGRKVSTRSWLELLEYEYGSETLKIELDTFNTIPWIEFLTAGVTFVSNQKSGWIVLVTSRPELVKLGLANSNRPTGRDRFTKSSERAVAFDDALSKLAEIFDSADCDSIQTPNHYELIQVLENYWKSVSCRSPGGIDIPGMVMITWGAPIDHPEFRETLAVCSHDQHFETLNDFATSASISLRLQFGAGWFEDSKSFLQDIKSAIADHSAKKNSVSATCLENGLPPPAMAAAATAKMVAFGWLPYNWNSLALMLGSSAQNPLSKKARYIRRLYDGGVRIFEIPRVKLESAELLDISDSERLQNEARLQFDSSHLADQALLAIEFTGYGKRSRNSLSSKNGKYFLYRLPLSSIGVLQRFFPWVKATAISYSQASSATCKAGILDRLVRLHMVAPQIAELNERLIDEIQSICYPSLPRPKINKIGVNELPDDTFLNLSRWLDNLISDQHTDSSSYACSAGDRESKRFSPLSKLISKAESLEISTTNPQLATLDLIKNIFPVSPALVETAIDRRRKSPTERSLRQAAKKLEREIKSEKNSAEIEDLPLTRKSHFRTPTLFRNLLRVLLGSVGGKLEIPKFIQKWVSSLFRFVWVVPQESLPATDAWLEDKAIGSNKNSNGNDSVVERGTRYIRSTYIGSPLSSYVYPHLFLNEPSTDAIEVSISNLLNLANRGTAAGIDQTGWDWVLNRIVQLGKLNQELRKKMHYTSDLDASKLAEILERPCDDRFILTHLSSETIIRCILVQNNGYRQLQDWSREIMTRVNALSKAEIFTAEDRSMEENLTSRLEVLEDACGIAVAALNYCRDHLTPKIPEDGCRGNDALIVYFSASRLMQHFRPQISYTSKGTLEAKENWGSNDGSAHNASVNFLPEEIVEHLAQSFQSRPFDLEMALRLLRIWYEEEGRCGDTPEDLMEEIKEELLGGEISEDFELDRKILLNAFHSNSE
ncbi:MAG: hypothetical protein ACSHX9_01550 [Luteolibacter sp.]